MVKVKSSASPVVVLHRKVTASKDDRSRSAQVDRMELNPPLFSKETVPSQVKVDLLYLTVHRERPPITSSLRPRQEDRSFLPKSRKAGMGEELCVQAGNTMATASKGRKRKENMTNQPPSGRAGSLADAEVSEDVVEQVIGRHSTRDAPELLQGLPVVHGEQVATEAGIESVHGTL